MGRGPKSAVAPRARRSASSGGKGNVVTAGPEYLRPKPGRALQPGRPSAGPGAPATRRAPCAARSCTRLRRLSRGCYACHEAATEVTRLRLRSRGCD